MSQLQVQASADLVGDVLLWTIYFPGDWRQQQTVQLSKQSINDKVQPIYSSQQPTTVTVDLFTYSHLLRVRKHNVAVLFHERFTRSVINDI